MGEIFRLATKDDSKELLGVILRAYEPIRKLGIPFPAATATLELVLENVTINDCFVLEIDGDIAATLTLSKGEEIKQITDLPFIKWFAVDPAYKKKGIGAKLITWVEEAIIRDTLQSPAVVLATTEKHPWLIAMYERRGYERFLDIDLGSGPLVFMRKVVNSELFALYTQEKEQDAGRSRFELRT